MYVGKQHLRKLIRWKTSPAHHHVGNDIESLNQGFKVAAVSVAYEKTSMAVYCNFQSGNEKNTWKMRRPVIFTGRNDG